MATWKREPPPEEEEKKQEATMMEELGDLFPKHPTSKLAYMYHPSSHWFQTPPESRAVSLLP